MTDINRSPSARNNFFYRSGWVVAIAVAMVLCIAVATVFVADFQCTVLFAIPLTVLACCGRRKALWWTTWSVLGLVFITYFLKYWLTPPATGPQFLSFRIANRALVAGMLWLLSRVLGMWLEAEDFRDDPSLSDAFDRAHPNLSAISGMLIAMPTVTGIALVDALTPGNFNLAVLYAVPLVTCAWTRSIRLLWTFFVLLQVLAIGGLYWGVTPYGEGAFRIALQNRILNGIMMFVVAGMLHFWIRSTRRSKQAGPGSPGDAGQPVVAR